MAGVLRRGCERQVRTGLRKAYPSIRSLKFSAIQHIVVVVILSMAQVASAGPFEDGLAAYQRSDFATALKL